MLAAPLILTGKEPVGIAKKSRLGSLSLSLRCAGVGECAGGLAWQAAKREFEPPRLAWKWSFPCESEAGSEGKTDTPVVSKP